jgi:YhcH/YjgK/YiaL family protein
MILDRLEHAMMYRSVGARVSAALNYLRRTDFSKLPEGRHELEGDRLFAVVRRYRTRAVQEARWEAHRHYLDVQYVVEGAERMGYAPLRDGLPVREPYNAATDLVFYDVRGDLFEVTAGGLAIFSPHDVHAPGLAAGEPPVVGDVLKVVVKCRLVPA